VPANGSILAANCDTPDPESASDRVCMRTRVLVTAGNAFGTGRPCRFGPTTLVRVCAVVSILPELRILERHLHHHGVSQRQVHMSRNQQHQPATFSIAWSVKHV
jgi:hypothetical protein